MTKETTVITRHIELYPVGDTKEERSAVWREVKRLGRETSKLANLMVQRLFYAEIEKRQFREQNPDATAKDVEQAMRDKYGCSTQNLAYEESKKVKDVVPSSIRAALARTLYKSFQCDLSEMYRGERSVRTYKKGMPIPFVEKSFRIQEIAGDYFADWVNSTRFYLNFGRDKSNNWAIIERIMSGEYQMCDSSIQVKDKNGSEKIFLLLAVKIPKRGNDLDSTKVVGVDLGLNNPAYVALNEGHARQAIGNRKEFLTPRLRIQQRRKEYQRTLQYTPGGKGRKKKLQALNRMAEKEANTVKTLNHSMSKAVIDFALKHRAGIIHMENLSGIARDEKSRWVLRNWSYFQLQQFIEYKAKMNGIEVRYIDPAYTSQTCLHCGNVDSENRSDKNDRTVFACTACGAEENADYVGAKNIACSTNYVEKGTKGKKSKSKNKADVPA